MLVLEIWKLFYIWMYRRPVELSLPIFKENTTLSRMIPCLTLSDCMMNKAYGMIFFLFNWLYFNLLSTFIIQYILKNINVFLLQQPTSLHFSQTTYRWYICWFLFAYKQIDLFYIVKKFNFAELYLAHFDSNRSKLLYD